MDFDDVFISIPPVRVSIQCFRHFVCTKATDPVHSQGEIRFPFSRVLDVY
jgi:hypothetical protein